MTDVSTANALALLEQRVEFLQDATGQCGSVGIAVDSNLVSASVDFDADHSLDETERLLAISIQRNGRRIVVESQALSIRCFILSQMAAPQSRSPAPKSAYELGSSGPLAGFARLRVDLAKTRERQCMGASRITSSPRTT